MMPEQRQDPIVSPNKEALNKEARIVPLEQIEGVMVTPLRRIFHPQGDIFHALKAREPSFCGFGEAYFSTIHSRSIKGWKKHLHMTLNLVVPVGAIRFVLIDDRKPSILGGEILLGTETLEKEIGKSIYARLTIPPGVWMAFQGCASSLNLLLNLADIEHDPQEAVSTELATFAWPWQF